MWSLRARPGYAPKAFRRAEAAAPAAERETAGAGAGNADGEPNGSAPRGEGGTGR
jgi:hypothetical protein